MYIPKIIHGRLHWSHKNEAYTPYKRNYPENATMTLGYGNQKSFYKQADLVEYPRLPSSKTKTNVHLGTEVTQKTTESVKRLHLQMLYKKLLFQSHNHILQAAEVKQKTHQSMLKTHRGYTRTATANH